MNSGYQPERDGREPTKDNTSKPRHHHYRGPTVEAVDDYSDTSPPEHVRTHIHVEQESSQLHPSGSGSPQSHPYLTDHSRPAESRPQSGQASHSHVPGKINPTSPLNETPQKKRRKSVSTHPPVVVHGVPPPADEYYRVHPNPVNVEHEQTEPHSQPGQATHTHVPRQISPTPPSPFNENPQRKHCKSVSFNPLIVVYTIPPAGEPRIVHFNPVNVEYEHGGAGSVYSSGHSSRSPVRADTGAPLKTMLDKNGDLLPRYH